MSQNPNTASKTFELWNRLRNRPGGKWLFTHGVCFKAPYFGSIAPAITFLEPGRCEVKAKNRRKVHNHIGTFHAIAACNMAELAAGVMTDATVPQSHRWIPKGMTVSYLAKASTDLTATAKLDTLPRFGDDPQEILVPVDIVDTAGTTVVRAEITMYVSPRKSAE